MQTVGVTIFHILVAVGALLSVSLFLGKRQIGELSQLEFILLITIGTVAGAGVVDPRIGSATMVISIVLLGFIQYALSWMTMKSWKRRQHKIALQPTVLIENGAIIKKNLEELKLPLEKLLGLLREKEVFNINEIQLAILETHGKISILKKPEFQPLKPHQVNVLAAENKILTPIIMEGKIQVKNLQKLGFTSGQIEEFRDQYHDQLDHVFIAFMDPQHQLYVINDDVQEKGIF
ncbi:hypothetical protein SDC9_13950 [bioreactor metagenome]|uniref:YetF C-terminal domain-containing protein n=1 Tax=bioreactor metagenome TaxID=1076179 RepID=A0A644TNQ5_9ZZZZ|nr:DUF421 domain-containing protein [Negativicutes bacterium]